jgi:kynurenine 3-monooxygenase
LALSERGINALRALGNDDLVGTILNDTIRMDARMVHYRNAIGKTVSESQQYDVHGRFQRSVDRSQLNRVLLDELDKHPNVKLIFQHKLTGADFDRKRAWLENQSDRAAVAGRRAPEIEISFDLMLGADGAHSSTRYHMMKFARLDYSQSYIDCLWCEFNMPPSKDDTYQISPNHLHIWPGGSMMFIALPNTDKSFTCTLFAPVDTFNALSSGDDSDLVTFFDRHFPNLTTHITPTSLTTQFRQNPHLPLISLQCHPHHYTSSAVILGDAANAMVPFYGQGMNAGLESVRILFEKLDAHSITPKSTNTSTSTNIDTNTAAALAAYTAHRVPDTYAIASLAMQNYSEMRSGVVSPFYKLRKRIEETLYTHLPSAGWATQYSRVSFSNIRYSEVVARSRAQERVLTGVASAVAGALGLMVLWGGKSLVRAVRDR